MPTLLTVGSYSSTTVLLNLLNSIVTILLTCPSSDTLLCYSKHTFFNSVVCIECACVECHKRGVLMLVYTCPLYSFVFRRH